MFKKITLYYILLGVILSQDELAASHHHIECINKNNNINIIVSGRARHITIEECQFDTHHETTAIRNTSPLSSNILNIYYINIYYYGLAQQWSACVRVRFISHSGSDDQHFNSTDARF